MSEERETGEGLVLPDDMLEEPVVSRPPPRSASAPARRKKKKDPRVGTVMDGRFEIKKLVARGGMGRIYEAVQQPLGRRVALKVMDLGYAEELDPDFQKRFFLEASTCAALSHPNTVRVFDYGSTGETYYIVMEYIDGATLLSVIDQGAPLDPLRVIHIARQICGSLGEAHGQSVIHRDLKPSNVLLTRHQEHEDFVKVLDFGLVKLIAEDAEEMTKSGLFLGSPNYMSPEQIRSNKIDQRADLYSLGVILYMALTGKSPFKRNSSVNVLLAQLEDDPPPFMQVIERGRVPDSLEWVVMTCLAKDPDKRFADVQQLNRALKAVEAELTGRISVLDMSLDSVGRVVVPEEVDDAIQSVRYQGSAPHSLSGTRWPKQVPDPVISGGSLVSRRLRRDIAESTASAGSGPSGVRSGMRSTGTRTSRLRKQRTPMQRLLGSPVFAMFLGALVVVLLLAVFWLFSRVVQDRGSDVVEVDEPVVAPEPSPVKATGGLEDLPMPPQPDTGPAGGASSAATPAPAATPRRVTSTPSPTPRAVRSAPTAAAGGGADTSPSTEPATGAGGDEEPAVEPTPEPAEETTPARRRPGGDLRDPWAD